MTLRIIANALSDCENTDWLPITNANKKNKDTDWSKLKNFDQVYKKKIDEIGGIYFIYIISQWLMGICAFIAGLFFLIGASISCFSVNKDDAIYFWIIGIIFLILLGLFLLIYLVSEQTPMSSKNLFYHFRPPTLRHGIPYFIHFKHTGRLSSSLSPVNRNSPVALSRA